MSEKKKVHVKIGDRVVVTSGKDKGKTGNVKSVITKDGTVLVEGVNLVTKAQKANPMYGIQGGLNKIEKPIDYRGKLEAIYANNDIVNNEPVANVVESDETNENNISFHIINYELSELQTSEEFEVPFKIYSDEKMTKLIGEFPFNIKVTTSNESTGD